MAKNLYIYMYIGFLAISPSSNHAKNSRCAVFLSVQGSQWIVSRSQTLSGERESGSARL